MAQIVKPFGCLGYLKFAALIFRKMMAAALSKFSFWQKRRDVLAKR